ncbi:hypothetical protein BKA70DRAFT_1427941 [Coprinopsis sp. MPI-PUGE-AT-0042]|nr:hypothetical protein BKA70DRAFT_1427941 [Coprinopsis sp. MPI-PUGE-AT-0042]
MSTEQAFPPGMDMSSPEAQAAAAAAIEQFKELLTAIVHITNTKYIFVAAAVVMFWDMCLTFHIEVQRVWKTRASLGKYLFFINRYIPPILFIFDGFYQLQPNPSLELYVSLAVLVLRTHALYQKQWLLYIMLCLAFITCGTMAGIFVYINRHFITFVPPGSLPGVPGCASECGDSRCRFLLIIFWIPFLILESLTVALTAWKSWTSYVAVGAHRSPFVTIVYRDGLVYYAVIMSMSLINLLIWAVAPPTLIQIGVSLLRSLHTTIASRILLNIRGMLDRSYGTASYFDSTASRTQVSAIACNSTTRTEHSESGTDMSNSLDYPLSALKNRSKREREGW